MATNNSINAPFPITAAQGGTGVASPTIHSILVSQGSSAASPKVLTNGQLLIGSTGADPVGATLTQGAGVTITNGAGTITIAANGGTTTNNVTGTSATLAPSNQYLSKNASLTTYTLPSSATLGDQFTILSCTDNTAGWTIAQNSGQSIRLGTSVTTAGVGGSLASTALGDTVTFCCVDATSGAEAFQVKSSVGNLTVV